jgi:alanine-alpha-ketoisovalerate/valine-pyruvate aminotransferase
MRKKLLLQMPSYRPVFGGLCFLTVSGRFADSALLCFSVSKLLLIGVLFILLLTGFC